MTLAKECERMYITASMTGGQDAESGKYSGDYGYEESRTYQ